MSNSISDASNTPELTQLILEHVTPQISLMNPGDITDAENLFVPEYWAVISGVDHRSLGTVISKLVTQNKLPLKASGINSSRHNTYRKI